MWVSCASARPARTVVPTAVRAVVLRLLSSAPAGRPGGPPADQRQGQLPYATVRVAVDPSVERVTETVTSPAGTLVRRLGNAW